MRKYIAYTYSKPSKMEFLGLPLQEKAHRSDAYLILGMRQPTIEEAKLFLEEVYSYSDVKPVYHVEEYKFGTSPTPLTLKDTTVFPNAVFAWREKQLPEGRASGYMVELATGIVTNSRYGVETVHKLFGVNEMSGIDRGLLSHDLAVELHCDPEDMEGGSFRWETEALQLPVEVVNEIWQAAVERTLQDLEDEINRIYRNTLPTTEDDTDMASVKRTICSGIQKVLEVVKRKPQDK